MAVLNKFLILLPALALAGCYEDFTPDVDTSPVLCVNSLITAGEPVTVDVSRTWLYTDTSGERNHGVPDATVSVYANDLLVADGYVPQEGDRIRVVAEHNVYGRAEAEVQVPVRSPIRVLNCDAVLSDGWDEITESGMMSSYRQFDLSIKLEVPDVAGVANFYRFGYSVFFPEGLWSDGTYIDPDIQAPYAMLQVGTFRYQAEPIFGEHIGVFESVTGSDAESFPFFTDRQFEDKSYTLNLQFNNMVYYVQGYDMDEVLLDCDLELAVSSVSESYYNLANYLWQVDNGVIVDLGDMGFGDPIWGYSNVSTGAGVLAAQATAKCRVNLKDFLKSAMDL